MTLASPISDAPTPSGRAAVSDKHCVFRVGTSWYSLLATTVREVMMTPDLVPVPGSHAAMAGLCHVRNEFIPVAYLDPLVGAAASERDSAGKMLVLGGAAGNWALLVDEVISLEALETLVNPEARSSDLSSSPVMGTATCRDQVVRVLDPGRLYRRAEERLRRCWSDLIRPLDDAPTSRLAEQ